MTALRHFLLALQFFTRIPVTGRLAAWVGYSPAMLHASSAHFPGVGWVVGGVAALVMAGALAWLPAGPLGALVAAVLATIATVWITGAFHEDGLADTADGLGGGLTRERALEIMKDSRIGSYGAVALIMVLLTKFCALVEIDLLMIPVTLIAGHGFSRLCAALLMSQLDYVRDEEGKAKPLATRIGGGELVFATITALLPLLLLAPRQSIPAVVLALLATLWLGRMFKKQIGGYTGDCLGATQQLSEVAFYCGMLCKFS